MFIYYINISCNLICVKLSSLCLSVGLSNGGIRTGDSATLPRTSGTREERLIKFSGIGPVDETGMPIASRSVSLTQPLQSQNAFLCHIFRQLEITMKSMAIVSLIHKLAINTQCACYQQSIIVN